MSRARITAMLVGAAALACALAPASALAGSYTFLMPRDFHTTPARAANPDHDAYGARSWSYVDGPGTSAPGNLSLIPGPFSTSVAGNPGLAGWQNSAGFVAENTTSGTLDGIPAGDIGMQPGMPGGAVAIGWSSPFAQSVTVTAGYTAAPAPTGVCLPVNSATVVLEDSAGNPISAGQPFTLIPGDGVYLVVHDSGAAFNASCDTTAISSFQVSVAGIPPAPTLTSPATGQLLSGQPVFSGVAGSDFGDAGTVTVNVYSGSAAGGTPLQSLIASRGGDGAYSVAPSAGLADGQYTAQAVQGDAAGDQGTSPPVTFRIHNTPPHVTLAAPAREPVTNSTPTLTGTASTQPGDAARVFLAIFPGDRAQSHYIRLLSTTRSPSTGQFSVRVVPALDDGVYTAVAVQRGISGAVGQGTITFQVKAHAPALTLVAPASGYRTRDRQPVFSGLAGTAMGDAGTVTVLLWRGTAPAGRPLGSATARVSRGRWSVRWPQPLGPGVYTARARQDDDAGHIARTPPVTFLILAPLRLIGSAVTLGPGNAASITVGCLAPATQTCTGTVLVLTRRSFQPVASGPAGQLRVLFAYVSIPGGQTLTVTRGLPAAAARALRRAVPVGVTVTLRLAVSGGRPVNLIAGRTLVRG